MTSPAIQPITPGATPAGHYSPGISWNGLVFVSGQLPFPPGATDRTVGTIKEQVGQAMANVEGVLTAGGSSLSQLLSVTIYITDIELWGAVNDEYARIMGAHRPSRAIVPVLPLHYDCQVEIQAIGAVTPHP
ncbi:MAG TPA: RidA family protein [Gemmatimonadales bacterium]|jgi:reactive intermediate/imine deaminase